MSRRALAGVALVAGIASSSASALADTGPGYCRTKACDDQAAYDDVWQTQPDAPCARDAVGCLLEGQPLHWPQSCISFSVQRDGSKSQGISFDEVHGVVKNAFDAWQNVDCGDGTPPSFVMQDMSPANCDHIEYNQDAGNANVFLFRDDKWPYPSAEDTLALTTITYNTENAEIYDADVEINSAQATFTLSDDPLKTKDDLLAVLTHEAGHFLGLSHVGTPQSTMYPEYSPGDLYQRTPNAGDIAGICDVFPPGETVNTSKCTPRHGFSRDCGGGSSTSSCALGSPRPAGGGAAGATLLFGVGLAGLRRARRRNARR